jgi:hypothetical protein
MTKTARRKGNLKGYTNLAKQRAALGAAFRGLQLYNSYDNPLNRKAL